MAENSHAKEQRIVDANGEAIVPGSVIKNIKDGQTGVVMKIAKVGERTFGFAPLVQVGDLQIRLGPGHMRITNIYSDWRHVPHGEQTYEQRYQSWMAQPSYYDSEYEQVSEDEYLAIKGIMALLPADLEKDYCLADRLEDALAYLVEHLTDLQKKGKQI